MQERREKDRVLFTIQVDGEIKMAVIMHNGPALGAPAGWHPESWAHCDVSEFPREIAEQHGRQIWTDRAGRAVPTYELSSAAGPQHCNWQHMTFLHVRGEQNAYLRNPDPDLLDEYFAEDWDPHASLPSDAYDTGFSRGTQHLWLSADRHRAYVGEVGAERVEMWPRTAQLLGCA